MCRLQSNIEQMYPIPRIEVIFSQIIGGKYFCTLDLSKAWLNYKMDEESAMMQYVKTQKRMFKVNRLMFGVKVAPGMWQKFIDKLLQGISGVHCYSQRVITKNSYYA